MAFNLLGDVVRFEGYLLKEKDDDAFFLVLDGTRRHIPDPPTFISLFGTSGVDEVLDIDSIPKADHPLDSLTPGAVLVRAEGTDPIYLVSNGVKRHITSPEAINKYHFHGSGVPLPSVAVNSIPVGDPINA